MRSSKRFPEANFTHEIATYLDSIKMPYSIEKTWHLSCGVKIRPDISLLTNEGKLAGIIEVKQYKHTKEAELERLKAWSFTRQYRRYHIPKVPVYFVCGPYTLDQLIQSL